MQNPPVQVEQRSNKCGAAVAAGIAFCGRCGAALSVVNVVQPIQSYGVREYRRTCRQCGKVWHSLVSRETQIKRSENAKVCNVIAQCCNPAAQLQASRNVDANRSEITRLRQCPICSSANYNEVILGR